VSQEGSDWKELRGLNRREQVSENIQYEKRIDQTSEHAIFGGRSELIRAHLTAIRHLFSLSHITYASIIHSYPQLHCATRNREASFPRYTQPDSNARYLLKGPEAHASGSYEKGTSTSTRNPKNWSRKCGIILTVCVIIIATLVIVVALIVTRENRYPDYSTLNYTLIDTFSGSSFFDNINYLTGYDPAAGFVQ
jgi:hypothetical protein